MNENKIINETLALMDKLGTDDAYRYLLENKGQVEKIGGQYYNFLYCLAALCNKTNEALDHMEEAIIEKGLWYRTAVFEDEDLDSIRQEERFVKCFEISEECFSHAKENVKTISTWAGKNSDKLVVALHGNQQNIHDSKSTWSFLEGQGYQVVYIQSSEIDSCDLFRWEDDGNGPEQLEGALSQMMLNTYAEKVLCGFSAGCNTILRALLCSNIKWTHIILQSPWIPIVESELEALIRKLKALEVIVTIICGNEDEDCLPLSKKLFESLKNSGVRVNKAWITGLAHDLPDNFEVIVKKNLD